MWSVRAIALVIGYWTAQILVRSGSNSVQADQSNRMVPGVPPDTGSALSHSGGKGTSSVGVALSSHGVGRPTEPSA